MFQISLSKCKLNGKAALTTFAKGVDDDTDLTAVTDKSVKTQFTDAIVVKQDTDASDQFGSLLVAATEEYCEKRAPILD